jgi:hypothetical protein
MRKAALIIGLGKITVDQFGSTLASLKSRLRGIHQFPHA